MARREAFHIRIPTPAHEAVIVPTVLLLVLQIVFGWPWWVFLVPLVLDVALILFAIVFFAVLVRMLNAHYRRRYHRALRRALQARR